jgi:hypothetical protein
MAEMSCGERGGTERWNRLYEVLAAEHRRRILFSLMNEPEERLPLPEAAVSPNLSVDTETLRIQLRHRHLPKLAAADYVRWSSDPFRVRRGPAFEEAATVIRKIMEPDEELPERLVDECDVLSMRE